MGMGEEENGPVRGGWGCDEFMSSCSFLCSSVNMHYLVKI